MKLGRKCSSANLWKEERSYIKDLRIDDVRLNHTIMIMDVIQYSKYQWHFMVYFTFPPFFYFSLLLPTFLALVYIRQITNRIVDSKSIVYGRSMGPARPGAIWHWGDLTLLSSRWLLFLFLFHSSRRKMVPLNSWGKVLHFFLPSNLVIKLRIPILS